MVSSRNRDLDLPAYGTTDPSGAEAREHLKEKIVPINPRSITPPANLVARNYTPPNGRKHPLVVGDSWISLATLVGVSPWDLIRYNYPLLPADAQRASKEVNWYLQNYVRCTLLTPDNQNYRFSPPGEIWLPNAAVALTPDQIATNLVLSTLRDPVIKQMNFGVGFLIIGSTYYEDIAKAIQAGKIVIKSNPALSGLALYYGGSTPARIEISPTISDMGLIVHECTHAIFDMMKRTTNVEQSEGFGYISQALYGLLKSGPTARYSVPYHWPPWSWISWQTIFDESKRLAALLKTKRWVSESEAAELFGAFKNTQGGGYDTRSGKVEKNDGI
jgi:hypothetical protein